jgi:hypothetical protein
MSNPQEQHWSICLQSRQGRQIVKISDHSSTQDLLQLASDTFQQDAVSLKYGFPPKQLPAGGTQLKDVIQNQERLQVEFGTSTTVAAAGEKNKKSSSSSIDSTTTRPSSGRGRSKRAAAKAATEAMPAIIKAQDEMMKTMASPTKKRPRRTTTSSNNNRGRKKAAPKFSASAGSGRRLTDGATVASPARRKQKNILQTANSSNDMSESLLGALNDSGKMGQVLRKGMKNAVVKSYETTRAFSRLAAIQNQSFQMVEETSTSSNSSGKLKITYKGTVDKSMQTEEVDCIPRDILEAVIKGIHTSNQEALRAENLALLSPRVLWSLVHAIPDTPNVGDCYNALLPDLDWSFLRRRAQQLSEKALENSRQEQEAKGEGEVLDMDQAQEAIDAVEHAMEHLHEHERAGRSTRQAQAALARLEQHVSQEEWKLGTPNEVDRDELRECIQAAPPRNPDMVPSLITKLVKDCHIHNWRELANAKEEKDSMNRIPVIAKKFDNLISHDQILKWIDKAQELSVDEIIVEICDGNVEAVEALTEQARSGTPKDLANWRLIPEVLHGELQGDDSKKPTIAQLATWSQRAHHLLQQYEWLNWYATPVE